MLSGYPSGRHRWPRLTPVAAALSPLLVVATLAKDLGYWIEGASATALNQSGASGSLDAIPGSSGVSVGAQGTDEGMAATISACVGNRLYLGYGVGIHEPVNALTARLDLRTRLGLEVVSRPGSFLDLYYRFDTH